MSDGTGRSNPLQPLQHSLNLAGLSAIVLIPTGSTISETLTLILELEGALTCTNESDLERIRGDVLHAILRVVILLALENDECSIKHSSNLDLSSSNFSYKETRFLLNSEKAFPVSVNNLWKSMSRFLQSRHDHRKPFEGSMTASTARPTILAHFFTSYELNQTFCQICDKN